MGIVALLVVGCGDGAGPALGDMTPAPPTDLSAVVVDISPPPAPPDMAVAKCTTPMPGIYSEYIQFNWVPLGGGVSMGSGWQSQVVVKNDGAIERPTTNIPAPTLYHCLFTEADLDKDACLAPCCPKQATSPLVYFEKAGWTMWIGGTCQYQTTGGIQYSATIVDVEGAFSR